jgi:hypothetical protein
LLAVETDRGFGSADLVCGLFGQVVGVAISNILEFGRLLAFYTTISIFAAGWKELKKSSASKLTSRFFAFKVSIPLSERGQGQRGHP